jgi:hypothetical protein
MLCKRDDDKSPRRDRVHLIDPMVGRWNISKVSWVVGSSELVGKPHATEEDL